MVKQINKKQMGTWICPHTHDSCIILIHKLGEESDPAITPFLYLNNQAEPNCLWEFIKWDLLNKFSMSSYEKTLDVIFGRWKSQTLYAGVKLGVFDNAFVVTPLPRSKVRFLYLIT